MSFFRRSQQPDSSAERTSTGSGMSNLLRRLRGKRSHSHQRDPAGSGSTPSQQFGDESTGAIAPRNEAEDNDAFKEAAVEELVVAKSEPSAESLIIVAPSSRPTSTLDEGELGLWSAAYREAVESQKTVDQAILKVGKIHELFVKLEATESGTPDDSLFRKGLKQLEKIKGPLKQFKLVLDVTSPLASAEPAAATVIGVVQGVTALAISLATARETLTANIGEMLEQIQVIDECDSVGQKLSPQDDTQVDLVHVSLVRVYSTMLEFYGVAYELLHMRSGKLMIKLVQDNTQLPGIISRFIQLSKTLKMHIDLATTVIVEEIHDNVISMNVRQWLGFDKILARDRFHTTADEARSDVACEWLLEDETFRTWYNEPGSSELVLTGEMGCGKTVLTTYVTSRILLRTDYRVPRSLVLYHYCRDDESGNALYITQSLVLQLLHQYAKPWERHFHRWYNAICSQNKPAPTTDLNALLSYFHDRVIDIGKNREVIVVLDGLDECDTKIGSIVAIFKQLPEKVPNLKVLYSTRPHARILNILENVPQLSINSKLNHSRDETIARHLVKKLEPKLGSEEEGKELIALLVAHLAQSAQGSAIWIRVMVDLVDDHDIIDIGDMRDFLEDSPEPQELSTVYAKLLKNRVKQNPKLLAIASRILEILAVSRRLLSVHELAYAVALTGCDKTHARLQDIETSPNKIKQLIEPFVAQYNHNDPALPQIKLLHRSLQELIFRRPPSEWISDDNSMLSQYEVPEAAVQKRRAALELQMFHACARYLLLEDINDRFFFAEDDAEFSGLRVGGVFDDASTDASETPDDIATFDPVELGMGSFFVYAACYWLEHCARLVEPSPEIVDQVIRLGASGSVRLRNWGNQYCRPECTKVAVWLFETEKLDPLSLAALYGSEDLLRAMLGRADRFKGPEFKPDTVLEAAKMLLVLGRRGDIVRLQGLFFDGRTGPSLRFFNFFRAVLHSWSQSDQEDDPERWNDAFDLVRHATGDLVREGRVNERYIIREPMREGKVNELLCESARCGCVGMMERLFDEGRTNATLMSQLLINTKRDFLGMDTNNHWQYNQSVGEAVLSNKIEAVRYLLDQPEIGPHFRHRNYRGYTVFHMVARSCNPAILELLLQAQASRPSLLCCDDEEEEEGESQAIDLVNYPNNLSDTALNQVVFESQTLPGRLRCIELLLTLGGADPNVPRDDIGNRPLTWAAIRGDLDLIRLLTSYDGGVAVDPGTILVPVEDSEGDEDVPSAAAAAACSSDEADLGVIGTSDTGTSTGAERKGMQRRKMTLGYTMTQNVHLRDQVVDLLVEIWEKRNQAGKV